MIKYIGTKLINAEPMTRGEYNKFRGWDLPSNEDGSDEGYLVEYLDGSDGNVESHKGYVSWSPKGPFEKAYRPSDGMPFGLAVEAMKKGLRVARTGWNGKGMFCFLVDGSKFEVNRAPLNQHLPEGQEVEYRPHIDLKAADGTIGTWSPSNSDALADDWIIVEEI